MRRGRAPRRSFNRDVVLVHREPAPGSDGYGEPVLEEAGQERLRANIQQTTSRELTVNQDTQIESWNMYFPAGVKVGGFDRVLFDDVVVEVFGPGRAVLDLGGRAHHVEALGKRVT